MDRCMPTCRRAGMEVWRHRCVYADVVWRYGGLDRCMPTCRCVGMEVWRSGRVDACVRTRRRADMEVWRYRRVYADVYTCGYRESVVTIFLVTAYGLYTFFFKVKMPSGTVV